MAPKPSILVVGSMNMDLVLQAERVPAAGETLVGDDYSYVAGGKGGNQAVAAALLGADVTFVGRVGADPHGARLKQLFESFGISTERVTEDTDLPTGLAVIVVEDSGENRIVVYPGANLGIREKQVEEAFDHPYDVVMINLEVADEIIVQTHELARKARIPVILDAGPAKPFDLTQLLGLEILSPNETETTALTGLPCRNADEAAIAAQQLMETSQAQFVVIKLGVDGSLLYDGEDTTCFSAYPVQAVDTTAAGDAFTAALTAHYMAEGNLPKAIRYASVAGALTVTKLGAQPSLPSEAEVAAFIKERGIALD